MYTLVLTCATLGCAPSDPEPAAEAPPDLTPERARDALIELIRSPNPGELKDFPLGQFIGDEVKGGTESPSWGPFALHLRDREYTYSRAFGQPPRVCRWQYRGRFELRGSQWVALPPQVESQALGPD
jgi:hypothetical protein